MRRILIVGVSLLIIFILILGISFGYEEDMYEEINLDLRDNSNIEILKKDIYNFISLVDDYLIPKSSFEMSDKLNENYDFLTEFAISFILDNSYLYNVIEGKDSSYTIDNGVMVSTNKYVRIEDLYDVTYDVFGVGYYYILSDYIDNGNSMIPLLEIDNRRFDMEISQIIDIVKGIDYYDVYVKYKDNEIVYIYRFDVISDKLVIGNLSVGE